MLLFNIKHVDKLPFLVPVPDQHTVPVLVSCDIFFVLWFFIHCSFEYKSSNPKHVVEENTRSPNEDWSTVFFPLMDASQENHEHDIFIVLSIVMLIGLFEINVSALTALQLQIEKLYTKLFLTLKISWLEGVACPPSFQSIWL